MFITFEIIVITPGATGLADWLLDLNAEPVEPLDIASKLGISEPRKVAP